MNNDLGTFDFLAARVSMKRSYSARAARVAAVAASNTTSAKSDIRLVDMTYLSLVLPRVFTCFRIGLQAAVVLLRM